ncbi:DUF4304 domain-containing protein [Mucilaginibacter mali]|uniref:DUF4304 domain-containing protein n=1 Tax=Mucilaginibacter mali TaxID=2740462 RepID=A0A7D4TWV2_9SPHI|nr:DUF4304 domain-containing protein [Mucilaginibacter mali]QKJ29877.1 DUF4304 domain-containing protein [Mucilaginibacter mali]
MERNLTLEFKAIVKNTIAPILKSIDFKKNGLNFTCISNDLIQCVNIQLNRFNHSERVEFTVNLGFFNTKLYQVSTNREIPTSVKSDDCYVRVRVGRLIHSRDKWYLLDPTTSDVILASEIENDFKQYVIPLFKKLKNPVSLLNVLRDEDNPYHLKCDPNAIAIMELEYGAPETGKRLLLNSYREAIIPKSIKNTSIYPDGRKELKWSEPFINQDYINNLIRMADIYDIML